MPITHYPAFPSPASGHPIVLPEQKSSFESWGEGLKALGKIPGDIRKEQQAKEEALIKQRLFETIQQIFKTPQNIDQTRTVPGMPTTTPEERQAIDESSITGNKPEVIEKDIAGQRMDREVNVPNIPNETITQQIFNPQYTELAQKARMLGSALTGNIPKSTAELAAEHGTITTAEETAKAPAREKEHELKRAEIREAAAGRLATTKLTTEERERANKEVVAERKFQAELFNKTRLEDIRSRHEDRKAMIDMLGPIRENQEATKIESELDKSIMQLESVRKSKDGMDLEDKETYNQVKRIIDGYNSKLERLKRVDKTNTMDFLTINEQPSKWGNIPVIGWFEKKTSKVVGTNPTTGTRKAKEELPVEKSKEERAKEIFGVK